MEENVKRKVWMWKQLGNKTILVLFFITFLWCTISVVSCLTCKSLVLTYFICAMLVLVVKVLYYFYSWIFDSSEVGCLHYSSKRMQGWNVRYNQGKIIQSLRWKLGAVLPQEIQMKLSHSEKEYFKSYSKILGSHMSELDLDLTVVGHM